jgi:CelD/BcsL family acetyltransferase involved in cellulose biosynthesis
MLGEVPLCEAHFRALVLETHFLKLTSPLEQLVTNMKSVLADVDVVVLGSAPVQSAFPKLSRAGGSLVYSPKQFPRYYVDLTMTFEAYLEKFSAKTRSTLRRKVRKFQEFSGGMLDCREYRTPSEFEEFYALAIDLSRQTYQHRLLDKGLPTSESFLSSARTLSSLNKIRAYLLFHDGRPVAYLYCPIADGVLIYAYLGYDAKYSEWSCGTVLQYLVLQRLFAERTLGIFDFTEGDGESKRLFATGMTLCAQILCFRLTPRNFLLVGSHAMLASTSDRLVKLLDRLGLKRRIKRMLRRI